MSMHSPTEDNKAAEIENQPKSPGFGRTNLPVPTISPDEKDY